MENLRRKLKTREEGTGIARKIKGRRELYEKQGKKTGELKKTRKKKEAESTKISY